MSSGNGNILIAQADATRLPLPDQSVDLIFESPPYLCARTYGIGAQRDCQTWIDWMLAVVAEGCRVCRGLVLVNCAGVTRDWCYRPGPEGLLYEWWRRGGQCWRPAYWNRVGIPGSGGKQWLRADVEYVLAFKAGKGPVPWADNTANGHPPKWGPGGEMSHRNSSGKRVNQWGPEGGANEFGNRFKRGAILNQWDHGGDGPGCVARKANGERDRKVRPSHVFGNKPSRANARADGNHQHTTWFNGRNSTTSNGQVLANPGNLVKVIVGGGVMGSKYAHENEAPFPVDLAAWFIRSHCPSGGVVLDCFGGSGTTADAARRLGRRAITLDLRMSQCELTRRRLAEPVKVKGERRPPAVAPGEMTLFGAA